MNIAESDKTCLIVGAGLTGVHAAEAIRAAGFEGRIVLAGDEAEPPYDRPPLSKQVLMAERDAANVALRGDAFYVDRAIELRLGSAAQRIDRGAKRVFFADGTCCRYDKLLLATGSSLRTVPTLELGTPNVFYLRQLSDAIALRDAMGKAERMVIVGAGVIGLEVAAAAATHGLHVTVLEAGERPMARATCVQLCKFIMDQHEKHGVRICTGTVIESVGNNAGGYRLTLSNGVVLEADLVVVGVGVMPNVVLAQDAGLRAGREGIYADGQGCTDDPWIYAAGEVAFHYTAHLGRHDRQENWHHAAAHGAHVGRAMVSTVPDYQEISGYWSDQYEFSVQSFGVPMGERDVVRGDPCTGRFAVFHLAGGRVRGVSSIGAARDMRIGKALVKAAASVPEEVLSDVSVDLAAWQSPTII